MGTYGSYSDLATAVGAIQDGGDLEGALALLTARSGGFPLHAGLVLLWRASLTARLGRTAAAFDLLDEALTRGCRYREEWLREVPGLALLRDEPRFDRIVARASDQYREAQLVAAPKLAIEVPSAEPTVGIPLLMALHGNNSNLHETRPKWASAVAEGWLLAVPQSAEIGLTPDSYVWNDRDRSARDLAAHLEHLWRQYRIDRRRVVLAGFSMGGTQAVALALTRRFPARGFISVGAWLPRVDEFASLIAGGAGVPAYVVVGDQDVNGLEGARSLVELLARNGIPAHLDARPGLGHAYPPDMRETLSRALAFAGAGS